MVDSNAEVSGAVGRGDDAEAVVAFTAGNDGSRQSRKGTSLADEVGGVLAGELEVDRLDGAVVLAEGVVGDVDVLVVGWVWWRTAVGRVGALRSLSGGSRKGGTEEGGDSEELHRDSLSRVEV